MKRRSQEKTKRIKPRSYSDKVAERTYEEPENSTSEKAAHKQPKN